MSELKSTRLNVRGDRPTAISSVAHGSNLDAVGFNLAFLATRNPNLAIEVIKLYALAHEIKEEDPQAHDEDFALFANKLAETIKEKTDQ